MRLLRRLLCWLLGHDPGLTFWFHGLPAAYCRRCGTLTDPITREDPWTS